MSSGDARKQKWTDSSRRRRPYGQDRHDTHSRWRRPAFGQSNTALPEHRPRTSAPSQSGDRRNHSASNVEQSKDSRDKPKSVNSKEIPGFYYDAVKKRYFKITSDHPRPHQSDMQAKEVSAEKEKTVNINVKCRKTLLTVPSDHVRLLSQREMFGYKTGSFRRAVKQLSTRSFSVDQDRCATLDLSELDLTGKVQISSIVPDVSEERVGIVSKITHSPNQFAHHSLGALTWKRRITWCRDVFTLRNATAWTTKWNSNPAFKRTIGIGSSGYAITTGIDRFSPVKYPTGKSDVFALEFGKQSSTMYAGSRDGKIRCFDLRSPTSAANLENRVSSLKAGVSVDCLKLLNDDYRLLASTMEGNIGQWDLRTGRRVLQYKGHQNTHSRLLFHVDNFEDFLLATGEDSVTKVWDLRTAQLINQIPCYTCGSTEETPVRPQAIFCKQLGGQNGISGLLYGVNESVYFHPP